MNRLELDKQRKKLEDQLAAVQEQLNELNTSSEDIQLAEGLHDMQCHSDHTEQCDWSYGKWTDDVLRYSRKHYLEKAQYIQVELDATWGLNLAVDEILALTKLLTKGK